MKLQICKICGITCKCFGTHLKYSHEEITYEQYYIKYIGEPKCNICPECGKPNVFRSLSQGFTKFCSKSCCQRSAKTNEKRKNTSEQRYGTRNYRNIEKSKKTKLERHGDPYYSNKEKANETKRHKTSDDLLKIKNKSIETRMNKYGAFVSKESIAKTKQTKKERYGSETYNNREAAQNTCIVKYGVNVPLKNEEIVEKAKQKRFEKYPKYYDVEKYESTKEEKKNGFINRISDVYEGIEIEDYFNDDLNRPNLKYKCEKCGAECTELYQLVYKRMKRNACLCTKCYNSYASYSSAEKEVVDFVKNNGLDTLENDRTILKGKELDIYIPEKKIAIEFDGLFWHNDRHVDKNAHLWKTEECQKQGIRLIHIFEDEWKYKKETIKSRLISIFGKNTKLFARKTEWRKINELETKKFLEENYSYQLPLFTISYGLFYHDELVSVMTFIKSSEENEIEITSFCSKLFINVIGGASKILSNFMKDYEEITSLVSYVDRRWSEGEMFMKMGFSEVFKTPPDYFYIVNGRCEKYLVDNCDKIYDVGKLKFRLTKL